MYDWVASDLHFCHGNIIHLSSRPFMSTEEMNRKLITYWNDTVQPKDHVLFMGDFGWGKYKMLELIRAQLHGTIDMVIGNHDNIVSFVGRAVPTKHGTKPFFNSIKYWHKDRGVVFSHIALPEQELDECGWVNVHGHSHQKTLMPENRYRNVCVEQTDYRPVSYQSVMDDMLARKKEYYG